MGDIHEHKTHIKNSITFSSHERVCSCDKLTYTKILILTNAHKTGDLIIIIIFAVQIY